MSDYAELVRRARERADSYRQSGPSAEHTAKLLEEMALAIESLQAKKRAARREALEPLRRKAQENADFWENRLQDHDWRPRRTNIEVARSQLQHIANDIRVLIDKDTQDAF
jgi:hypothetical protein